ncbi:MAG: glycoside hydrolase family 57 protein [bacterium]
MPSVCFYFQVHQPWRIKPYKIFDIGDDHNYFNYNNFGNLNNEEILKKVARNCYIPTNQILLELLKKYPEFKISFSISGVALEQFEKFCPVLIESFQKLVRTGRVEMLSETYYHSLSCLYSKEEFIKQVKMHKKKINELFNYSPKVFRNTELIYNNALAAEVEKMGYKGILADGVDHIMQWRSPNFLYKPVGGKNIKLLLKNYRLSDDIAFRFSQTSWESYPLYASTFAEWVSVYNGNGEVVNLFMDYETFGEHQPKESNIFEFLKYLPYEILKHPDNNFATPSEIIKKYNSVAELDVPFFISWADIERDLSAWLENSMQQEAINKIYEIEKDVLNLNDEFLLEDWRKLQTSDHFYYMSTKWFSDGDVHKYFNPYNSPYEAFISYMNVVNDLKMRIENYKNMV